MRKRLCYFYNILASYPVIVLLLAGLVGLFYLARQHYPLEMQLQAKNLQRIELKQELKALQQKLKSIEQNDLRMRYVLFNEEFLKYVRSTFNLASVNYGQHRHVASTF